MSRIFPTLGHVYRTGHPVDLEMVCNEAANHSYALGYRGPVYIVVTSKAEAEYAVGYMDRHHESVDARMIILNENTAFFGHTV